MVFDRDRAPSHLPFSIVRKGFDRDEVTNYFARFEAELRVTATDRDAASAQARDLARQLENARNEIDDLRKDVDRLSVPPTTAEGMSDRISRMLRLASDEASELRARAESDAAEMVSLAEQEGIRLRGDFEKRLEDLENRRLACEEEHSRTMAAARTEADRIVAAARAEADRRAAEAESKREQVQQDFEITMSERRSKLLGSLDELERSSKGEAERRLEQATSEASRRLAVATEASERKIANAKGLTEELLVMRGRILGQLDAVREQLDGVPDMLAAATEETDLLARNLSDDTPAPSDVEDNASAQPAAKAESDSARRGGKNGEPSTTNSRPGSDKPDTEKSASNSTDSDEAEARVSDRGTTPKAPKQTQPPAPARGESPRPGGSGRSPAVASRVRR
ncbi:hypothetical protein MWU77_16040 [Rhodococcus sp. F64268]|uniref:hypothetical protein n=1 Tax=unclassified Rhodococcus (in: high G+C Gram-positive bacteria) TaxID=192944 RepID=UPI001F0F5AFB|nr:MULTISPECIES: hypothetical protein [unclassified Rhodococcus (in: high G+C Gram-positive bacteria)]MCK0092291.1 hypothetical protein [Rhodococcus sp. F64268]